MTGKFISDKSESEDTTFSFLISKYRSLSPSISEKSSGDIVFSLGVLFLNSVLREILSSESLSLDEDDSVSFESYTV